MSISRRAFLFGGSAACLAAAFPNRRISAAAPLQREAGCGLIPRLPSGIALEMPISASSLITPTDCFYVFNHSQPDTSDPKCWIISVGGHLAHPQMLSLDQLAKFGQIEVTNTLECAGNGRAFFKPTVPGILWERGAVGNAVFCGPRLADVLALTGILKSAKHIIFTGADSRSPHGPRFIRSIPAEKALDPNTILATSMNGMPLSQEHGSPIRVVVPGWIGAASVKRVTAIIASQSEAEGQDMQASYRLPLMPSGESTGSSRALTSLRVKSIITAPRDREYATEGPIVVRGFAWAGEAEIAAVEISTNLGDSWCPARMGDFRARYAWRSWEYRWLPPHRGEHEIWVKATDTWGETQPLRTAWNPRGYMWNGIDRIRIVVS